jgi:pantetheine-phosphate adenylyltransferase
MNKISTNNANKSKYDVCAALIMYPFSEKQKQINSEIIRLSVEICDKKLYIVFVNEGQTNRIKNYIGDLYNIVWDLSLSADKHLLETIISIPDAEKAFTSAIDILSKPELDVAVYIENDATAKLLNTVGVMRSSHGNINVLETRRVNENIDNILRGDYILYDDEAAELPQFETVVLGGTFDYLHNGHKRLLTMTAMVCTKEVTIGVTSDLMLRSKKFAGKIQPLNVRKGMVREFLSAIKPSLKVNIETIDDAFGPSIRLPNLKAITGSAETLSGCLAVNKIRRDKGMNELKIIITSRAQSFTLSSTFLRKYLTNKTSNI